MVEAPLDARAWVALAHHWDLPAPGRVYAPKGCLECRNTGFFGRTGIYDIRVTNRADETVAMFRGKSAQIKGTLIPTGD